LAAGFFSISINNATAAGVPPAPAIGTPIKVFLLGGQSNMRGRASVDGLPSALRVPREDVLICRGSTGTVGTVLEFLQPNDTSLDGSTFGPDLLFGHTIADLYPDVHFALIKYAYGGTALVGSAPSNSNNWAYDPDGGSYLKFQETVTNGLAELVSAGYAPEIVGMLWHQGESNVGNPQATYEGRLNAFIADVRSLYGADLPFLIGGINTDNDVAGDDTIVAAQQAVAAADPNAVFIPVDDLNAGDRWHFDTPSMMTLGERFATTYQANFASLIVDTSDDFTPPTPAQMGWQSPPAAISDTEITMTAAAATDDNGVEYYFASTSGGGNDSGWQTSPTYVDTGLSPDTSYSYTVQARDLSENRNTNLASAPATATTDPADVTPPPVPALITPVGPVTSTDITVEASVVVDGEGNGVEYRFTNTTRGTDSGWLSTPSWTNTALDPRSTYFYTVQARDTATALNASEPTAPASATTLGVALGGAPYYEGFAYIEDTKSITDWSIEGGGSGNTIVLPEGLNYGTLPTSGGALQTGGWFENDATLNAARDAGLLDDGATLWMSVLARNPAGGSNWPLMLGQGRVNRFGSSGDMTGDAIGFWMGSGGDTFMPDYYLDGSFTRGSSGDFATGNDQTVLLVVEMRSHEDTTQPDTMNSYKPSIEDVANGASGAVLSSLTTVAFDNLLFNTLSYDTDTDTSKAAILDELRIGSSYEDVIGVGSTSAYSVWAAENAPTSGTDPGGDEDQDGVSNVLEFVLGGSLTENDLAKLPRQEKDGSVFTFSFERAQASIDPAGLVLTIEVSNDLGGWPDVYLISDTPSAGPVVTVEANSSPGFDRVTLTLPVNGATKKFARLKATTGE